MKSALREGLRSVISFLEMILPLLDTSELYNSCATQNTPLFLPPFCPQEYYPYVVHFPRAAMVRVMDSAA